MGHGEDCSKVEMFKSSRLVQMGINTMNSVGTRHAVSGTRYEVRGARLV